MTDAEWRSSYVRTQANEEVALSEETALAESEAASAGQTPLWVGLLRLALAVGAVATGSPWALLVVLWVLLAHVLLED